MSVSFNGSLLYQISDNTRIGLGYRTGVDMELEGDPEFKGLSTTTRDLLDAAGLLNIEIDIESELLGIVMAGIYHEFDNGWGWALDVAGIGWSDFRLTEFGFLEGTLFQQDTDYDDVWVGSTGVSISVNDRWTLGVGVSHSDSPTDDDERTFLFRVDETWLFGVAGSTTSVMIAA